MTLKIRPNAIEQEFGPFTFPGIRLPNDGLHVLDTDASHHLIIRPGSNLSADRIFTIVTGDAARTITLSGNPTLGDWFDQPVKQASTPTFGGITIADGGTIGQAAGPLLTFDDTNNFLEIMGCKIGIGTTTPTKRLEAFGGILAADANHFGILLENIDAALAASPLALVGRTSGTGAGIFATAGHLVLQPRGSIAADIYFLDGGGTKNVVIKDGGNVGIGTDAPGTKLHSYIGASGLTPAAVGGATFESNTHQYINFLSAANTQQGIIFGAGGSNIDAHILWEDGSRGDYLGISSTLYVKTSGNVGIGTSVPLAKLHIDQSSSVAAVPVLTLDQADIDIHFIEFIGAAALGNITQSIVENTDSVNGTLKAWLKIYVDDVGNQIPDQTYYIPIHTLSEA